jgi:hypothetical protein
MVDIHELKGADELPFNGQEIQRHIVRNRAGEHLIKARS